MKQTKGAKFLELFNDIDDKYLKEAMNYTMKKKFNFKPVIAAAACAVFALTAIPVVNHFVNTPGVQQTQGEKIGANGNFTVYESGVHSSDVKLNADHKVEMIINTNGKVSAEKSKIDTQKTIEFGGKKWTGTYEDTRISEFYGNDEDNYGGKLNGINFSFSINRTTGMCTSFYASPAKDMEKTAKYTQNECYDIAVKYLAQYIDDADEYELKHVFERDWENGYYFMMYRTVNGIATSDRVSIGVRKTGEVYTHIFHSLGTMKNIDASALDMTVIDKLIAEKINKIYENNFDLTYEIEEIVLTKLSDGSYILDCNIEAEGKPTLESARVKDTCYLIITVD